MKLNSYITDFVTTLTASIIYRKLHLRNWYDWASAKAQVYNAYHLRKPLMYKDHFADPPSLGADVLYGWPLFLIISIVINIVVICTGNMPITECILSVSYKFAVFKHRHNVRRLLTVCRNISMQHLTALGYYVT